MKPKIKTIEAFRGDFTYINMGSEKLEEKKSTRENWKRSYRCGTKNVLKQLLQSVQW